MSITLQLITNPKTDCSEIEPRSLWRDTGESTSELCTSSIIELETQIMWLQWSISTEENGPFFTAWSLKTVFLSFNTSFIPRIRLDPRRLITFASFFPFLR